MECGQKDGTSEGKSGGRNGHPDLTGVDERGPGPERGLASAA